MGRRIIRTDEAVRATAIPGWRDLSSTRSGAPPLRSAPENGKAARGAASGHFETDGPSEPNAFGSAPARGAPRPAVWLRHLVLDRGRVVPGAPAPGLGIAVVGVDVIEAVVTDAGAERVAAREGRLVLHSEIGVGYDVPWRLVEALLVDAAGATPGILPDPPPYALQILLGERVSIRDLATILEGIADALSFSTNPAMIAEHVRARLARQICAQYKTPIGYLPLIALSARW